MEEIMTNFTPVEAIIGGALIALSVAMMMLFVGRITGISGIFGGAFHFKQDDTSWRWSFLAGMVAGGFLLLAFYPQAFPAVAKGSVWSMAASGLLVGLGTRVGSGCTSGHGICGLARLSPRSVVSVLTFVIAGMATVYITQHVL